MPEGKRSCSILIICRFIGIAIVTPSTAIKNTQASMSGTDIDWTAPQAQSFSTESAQTGHDRSWPSVDPQLSAKCGNRTLAARDLDIFLERLCEPPRASRNSFALLGQLIGDSDGEARVHAVNHRGWYQNSRAAFFRGLVDDVHCTKLQRSR